MKKALLMIPLFLIAAPAVQANVAQSAPSCRLIYTPSDGGTGTAEKKSFPQFPQGIGIAGKVAVRFPPDGVVNQVIVAAEDDARGNTTVVITVDLANGSFNSNNTVFSNRFEFYSGQRVLMSILRPEGQVRFNFPPPPPVPGQPPVPVEPPPPLTFTGSTAWGDRGKDLLTKVINKIDVECFRGLNQNTP